MQTSTRNTYRCTVAELTEGPVSARVVMSLKNGTLLTAVITERSAGDLGLVVGADVFAMIKSTFIILTREGDPKTSACNRLTGTVATREDGPVNSEITLALGEGMTLTAIITRTSADALEIRHGDSITAIFKAAHVIVATP